MRATQAFFETTGGPEVIQWHEVDLPAPGPGEVLIRHEAVGLNFIDTYFRTGLYPARLPSGMGMEAAGVVEAVGEGVTAFRPGDKAGYFGSPGAYASARLIKAADLVPVPEGISSLVAAAVLLKGTTVEMLAERCAPVAPGGWALVPAAAGGVGLLLVQWLTARGVRVIGTVGSPEKVDAAKEAGAELVLLTGDEDLVARVREATGGNGVRVSYDGVGAATWQASLKSVGRRGTIASFGNASGPVPPFSPGILGPKGSLYVTRCTLFTHISSRESTQAMADELFAVVQSGAVNIRIDQRFALADVQAAHRSLEARQTTGCTVLLP